MLKLKAPRVSIVVEVWRCNDCGRRAPHHFYAHATRSRRMDYCAGKVTKTAQVLQITPQRLALTVAKEIPIMEIIEEACSN